MAVIELHQDDLRSVVLDSPVPVLIDFWAPWCGPCRMVSPIVDEIAEEETSVRVCKVNVDDEPSLAASFGVQSIPTLVVMSGGKVVNKSVGAIPKEDILDLLGL